MANGPILNIEREVAFGESHEERIIQRWIAKSPTAQTVSRIIGSGTFDDFDFWALTQNGFPHSWVEVKRRNIDFSKYGDAMFPFRKHEFAKELTEKHNLTVYGVTEYSCGTLVEVDLAIFPKQIREIERRDRPGTGKVKHGLWGREQMKVVAQ